MSKTLAVQISEELDRKIKLRLLGFGTRTTLKSYIIDLIQNDLRSQETIKEETKETIQAEVENTIQNDVSLEVQDNIQNGSKDIEEKNVQ